MSLLSLFIAAGADQATAAGDGGDPAITVRKLCDAVWTPAPERFDILLYRERMLKKLSPEDIDKMVKESLNLIYPKDAEVSPSERKKLFQFNVEQIKKEQEAPRRIVQRIRQDSERRRVDMAILKPDQDVSDAILSYSTISLGKGADAKGRNGLEISGMAKVANILPEGMKFAGTPVEDWLSVPFRALVWVKFGAPGEPGKSTRSDERVAKFLTGESGEAIWVRPVDEPRVSSAPLDRIEFFDVTTDRVHGSILCDPKNYGHVYEVASYDPATGQPRVVLKRGGYLPNGVATELESSTYDENSDLVEGDKIFFMSCNFNPVFKPSDFALEVPHGYGLVDARTIPNKVISRSDPTAPEDGDTIKQLLGVVPSDSLVVPNLVRAGLSAPRPDEDPK